MAMNYSSWLLSIAACLFGMIAATQTIDRFKQQCLSFPAQELAPKSHIQVLEYIPQGTNLTLADNDSTCSRQSQQISADICRVALSVTTSNRSSVIMELWLPREWGGRFLGTGNGGIDGCIKYEDVEYGALNGFATIGTNNGHNGTTAAPLYRNPDAVVDFSWRALHTGVTMGKELTARFYGRPHSKSYYIGCSLGGRQGIYAADAFPQDFDGIVAGAPALDFNNLVSWRANFFLITGSVKSPRHITASQWKGLIHPEILRQCDGIDNVLDGIIEDPTFCDFQPDILLCEKDQTDDCLSHAQVETVREIFSPLRDENDRLIYPAMQPGSEFKSADGLYAGKPFMYSESWFRYVIYDPSWDPSSFNLHDAQVADTLNPGNIRTWPRDLSLFQERGGKIIVFHGQQDDKITSFDTPRFYDHLAASMQYSSAQMDDFFRFFRVPGMFHCNSGLGAWVIGQGGGLSATGIPFTKERNVLAALMAWVEDDQAPETIGGMKFVEDNPELGEERRREHCRYPLRSIYVGGDASLVENWRCR